MDRSGEWQRTRAELDAVSPSFCLAKWLQVTLHLQNGFNHSCHHPPPHQTPLAELSRDPGALHNTSHKIRQRELMRQGARPAECAHCWKAEDAPGAHFSDRVVKSADEWAYSRMGEIKAGANSVNPSYLEVSFGNLCNFRCAYCMPSVSSAIWQQYERHGPYVGRASLEQVRRAGLAPLAEPNPYVKAFWDWLPGISRDLRVLRITGGEPLLSPHLDRLLDFFEERAHPDLELAVNSNLGVPKSYLEKFFSRLSKLKLRGFMLYTSCDTAGAHAEYVRAGLDYARWKRNLGAYLESVPWPAMVMAAFNVLSPPRFGDLLDDVGAFPDNRVVVDTSHVSNPEYLSPFILDDPWRGRVIRLVESRRGLGDFERNKLERLAASLRASSLPAERLRRLRGEFFLFTEQYREREGKPFLGVFPEMEAFYELCRESAAVEQRAKQ